MPVKALSGTIVRLRKLRSRTVIKKLEIHYMYEVVSLHFDTTSYYGATLFYKSFRIRYYNLPPVERQ